MSRTQYHMLPGYDFVMPYDQRVTQIRNAINALAELYELSGTDEDHLRCQEFNQSSAAWNVCNMFYRRWQNSRQMFKKNMQLLQQAASEENGTEISDLQIQRAESMCSQAYWQGELSRTHLEIAERIYERDYGKTFNRPAGFGNATDPKRVAHNRAKLALSRIHGEHIEGGNDIIEDEVVADNTPSGEKQETPEKSNARELTGQEYAARVLAKL